MVSKRLNARSGVGIPVLADHPATNESKRIERATGRAPASRKGSRSGANPGISRRVPGSGLTGEGGLLEVRRTSREGHDFGLGLPDSQLEILRGPLAAHVWP